MSKHYLISLLLFLSINSSLYASHVRGGEITWECISSGSNKGKFIFTLKIYRSCQSGAAGISASQSIQNPLYSMYGGPSQISVTRIEINDITPWCSGVGGIQCGDPGSAGLLVYDENIYRSAPVHLNGIPAIGGSVFSCAASGGPTCINTSSQVIYIRSVMYPYTDPVSGQAKSLGSSSNGPSCYDSSPLFAEKVSYLHSLAKTNYFTAKSVDEDCDSLHYEKAAPMQNGSGITMNTGYSYNNPFGSNSLNVLWTVDPNTGTMKHLTFNTAGMYRIAYKTVAYKNRQKVAEVVRDIILVLDSVYISNTYEVSNTNPTISFRNANAPSFTPLYKDTFNVGDSVHVILRAIDNDLLSAGITQTVSLRVLTDPALGQPFNPLGCQYSNCAELDTNSSYWKINTFSGSGVALADFKWKIGCEHAYRCGGPYQNNDEYSEYTFSVIATDNICRKPLSTISDFTIVVRDTSTKQAAFALVETMDGNARLTWRSHQGSGFSRYRIYKSFLPILPFSNFQTNQLINDTTTIDTVLSWNHFPAYYRVVSEGASTCNEEYNTVRTIVLNVHDSIRNETYLSWNTMFHSGNPRFSGYYTVEADSGSGWFQLAQKSHSRYDSILTLQDSITTCATSVRYRILAEDYDNKVNYISNTDSSYYQPLVFNESMAICDVDSVFLGGAFRNRSGQYYDTLQGRLGCDSVRLVNLTVNPSFDIYDTLGGCPGDSFLIFGVWQQQDALYRRNFRTKERCDSTVSIRVDIDTVDATVNTNGRKLVAKPNMDAYQWVECPSLTPVVGATSRDFTPSSNGNYAVIVTKGYCSETSECKEIVTAGIDDTKSGAGLLVYPNPASDLLTFTCTSCSAGSSVILYNSSGAEVLRTVSQASSFDLEVSELPNGLYFYQFSSASVNRYARVVISR